MDPAFIVLNLGCKVNQAEGIEIEENLRRRGGHVTADLDRATDVIINTCAVTLSAERRVRRLVAKITAEKPSRRIHLAGCCVERDGSGFAGLPGVTGVFCNISKPTIAETLTSKPFTTQSDPTVSRTRPILKIQDGCDMACSFCIIPYVRGHQLRSMPPDDVIARINLWNCHPEIILTGVLLGSYGSDLSPQTTLYDLLAQVAGNCPPLRLSSIEPWHLNSRLADLLCDTAFIRPHLHIPLQTGSATVAQRMNRRHDMAHIRRTFDRLCSQRPDIAFGTDIIVGYPGETDAEFEESVNLMKELQFAYVHVFPFSPRPGTPAASRPDALPGHIISERSKHLRGVSRELNYAFRSRFMGRVLDAVVLKARDEDGVQAITENYIPVRLPEDVPSGRASILITRVLPDSTEARISY